MAKNECYACGVQLDGSYLHCGQVCYHQNSVKYKGKIFCESCLFYFKLTGYLRKELPGHVSLVHFYKDMSCVKLSTTRWDRIDKDIPLDEIKKCCKFFATLTGNQIHQVKIYSRIG